MGGPGSWDEQVAAVTRLKDALYRGGEGGHARREEREAVKRILAMWPDAAKLAREAWAFHGRAAAWAVGSPAADVPLPPARSVIITAAGYKPEWDGAVLPHSEAAAVNPDVRAGYCDSVEGIAALWEDNLADDPRAAAWHARTLHPEEVLAGAVRAPLEPPWNIHLPQVIHWLTPEEITDVLTGYAGLLSAPDSPYYAPGSSLVLSWGIPGGRPMEGKAFAIAEEVTGMLGRVHRPADVEKMIKDAGLLLHPAGIRDVRWMPGRDGEPDGDGKPRPGWAGEALWARSPGLFVGAVALVPLG